MDEHDEIALKMSVEYIISSVKKYLKTEQTNYAIMISGEWGCGKTYFIKGQVFDLIKGSNQRPIYISLAGVSTEANIGEKIFKYINPFHSKKSDIAKEADYLESIINAEKEQRTIPESIVLIFDDLERLDATFLRAALGYINVFIEHEKVKCIFVCNEEEIDGDFKKIKEKFIQQTFLLRPDFKAILNKKLIEKDEKHKVNYSSFINKDQIIGVFTKGRCFNLRTLFYVLHVFYEIAKKIDEEKIVTGKHKEKIYQLILNYCCFYAIEYRNGVDRSILNKITVSFSQDIWSLEIGLDESDVEPDFENVTSESPKENKDNLEQIKLIQERYFSGESMDFAYFGSAGHFIVTSYLNVSRLREEIGIVVKKLSNPPKIKIETDHLYLLNNDEYVDKINFLLSEAEKGNLELVDYMKLYIMISELNQYNVKGVVSTSEARAIIEKGIESAVVANKLVYVSNIEYQIHPFIVENEYDEAYNFFRDYIIKINETIPERRDKVHVKNVIGLIQSSNREELVRLIIDKENFALRGNDANEIYSALKDANANVIYSFWKALRTRYIIKLDNGVYSDMRLREMEFIKSLHHLLENDSGILSETPKELSYLQLISLKNLLNTIINEER